MKKQIGVLLIILLTTPLISKNCSDFSKLLKTAMVKLNGYTFVKEHNVYIKKSKNDEGHEYIPMTFNRGVKYKFYLVDSESYEGKLMLNVYNNMQRDFVVASNYHSILKKRYPSLEFTCQSTINGCLDFYFEEGKEGCAVAVASFKK